MKPMRFMKNMYNDPMKLSTKKSAKGPKLTEKLIEDLILHWLNLQSNCFAFKLNTRGAYSPKKGAFMYTQKWAPKGMPDIICSFHGKFIGFEVKTPTAFRKFHDNPKEHEKEQMDMIGHIRAKGGLCYVVCSIDQVRQIICDLSE